ncbi:MAG: 2-oxo-4-hydroxy-4-carboxy-5-ureidoimidazoline decarboxylase, partial [Granulosicoccus sp.]|nr:2-oxo-4-hydroxy-4-carboxy-5-ureidoimidazoline decarboxylase [Granulosicoccus sp.]
MPLSDLSRATFVQYFGGLFEHSSWVVDRAYAAGLCPEHDYPETLSEAFRVVVEQATLGRKLALINAHAELCGTPASGARLSGESARERSDSGLDHCAQHDVLRLRELNSTYRDKFGFPFVLCLREHNIEGVLRQLEQRLDNEPDVEFDTALQEILRIARWRLEALVRT